MLNIEHFALTLGKSRAMVIDRIQIANGQKVLFWGNNNIGKSLFLRSIHGLNSNYAGTIQFRELSSNFKKKENSLLLEITPHVIPEATLWQNIKIPFGKISKEMKIRIYDFLKSVNLHHKIGIKQEQLSFSETKLLEFIRAVVQLPHLLLIDDLDVYFDDKVLIKIMDIMQYAIGNGTTLIATAKRKLEYFDEYYREQDRKIVKLEQ